MECNVGDKERTVRMTIGIAAGVCALLSRKARWRVPLALIALGGIASATTGYCMVNAALGINSADADKDQAADKGRGKIAAHDHAGHKRQPTRM